MSTDRHPAACPFCTGTIVNQVQPDYLLRPAQLNDDGSIIVGDPTDGADFNGPNLLFCHGCGSTYVQPADVAEHYDRDLTVDYPEDTPVDGDPRYKGFGVSWVASAAAGRTMVIPVAGGESGE